MVGLLPALLAACYWNCLLQWGQLRPLVLHLSTVGLRIASLRSMLPVQLGFAGMSEFAWVFDWLMGSCGPVWGWHVRCTCSFFQVFGTQLIAGWFRWPWTSSLASPGYVQLNRRSTGVFNVFCGSRMGM